MGIKLLNFIINKARKRGKKYLKLYTGTGKEEKAAQKLYEKIGLKEIKRVKSPYSKKEMVIYREMKL